MSFLDKQLQIPLTKEQPLSYYLPWQDHIDENTLAANDGSLLQIIQLAGQPFTSASPEEITRELNTRTAAFKLLAHTDLGICCYFSKKPLANIDHTNDVSGLNGYPRQLLSEIGPIIVHGSFEITWYVAVVLGNPISKKLKFTDLFSRHATSQQDLLQKKLKRLHGLVGQFVSRLTAYQPKVLGIYNKNGLVISEPMTWLRWLTQRVHEPVPFSTGNIAQTIPVHRVLFHRNGTIQIGDRFLASITPVAYEQSVPVGALSSLQHLQSETLFCLNSQFIIRGDAQNHIRRTIHQFGEVGDDAVSQVQAMQTALDLLMAGEISFTRSAMLLTVSSSDPDQLAQDTQAAISALEESTYFTLRRNDVQAKAAFLWSIPGNWRYAGRPTRGLHTRNISSIITFESLPSGSLSSEWSPHTPLLSLKTIYDTLFHFNLHAPSTDLGHTTVIGQSSGGKTVLLNTLAAASLQFGARIILFDVEHGAEIFVHALNGHYFDIEPGQPTGWNPFDLPQTGQSTAFVSALIEQMLSISNTPLQGNDYQLLNEAVSHVFQLPAEHRRLSVLPQFLPQGHDSKLSEGLQQWVGEGARAWLFDNDNSKPMKLDNADILGFDLTNVLSDPTIKGIAFRYLAYIVQTTLFDGTPTFIALDEGWAYLEDPVAGAIVRSWSKTGRRNGLALVMATNNPQDITTNQIGRDLAVQSPTNLFLASPRSRREDYQAFDLSDDELDVILSLRVHERHIAIKQGTHFTVLQFDLGKNNDCLHVLSSRKNTTALMQECRSQHGPHPGQWLEHFLDGARSLRRHSQNR